MSAMFFYDWRYHARPVLNYFQCDFIFKYNILDKTNTYLSLKFKFRADYRDCVCCHNLKTFCLHTLHMNSCNPVVNRIYLQMIELLVIVNRLIGTSSPTSNMHWHHHSYPRGVGHTRQGGLRKAVSCQLQAASAAHTHAT